MDCLTKFVKFFLFLIEERVNLRYVFHFKPALGTLMQQVELGIFQLSFVPELKWYDSILFLGYLFYIIHFVELCKDSVNIFRGRVFLIFNQHEQLSLKLLSIFTRLQVLFIFSYFSLNLPILILLQIQIHFYIQADFIYLY